MRGAPWSSYRHPVYRLDLDVFVEGPGSVLPADAAGLEAAERNPELRCVGSLERTVAGLRFSSFLNSGQACVAQTRILAPRARYDEYLRGPASVFLDERVQRGDPLRDTRPRPRLIEEQLRVGVSFTAGVHAGLRVEFEQ